MCVCVRVLVHVCAFVLLDANVCMSLSLSLSVYVCTGTHEHVRVFMGEFVCTYCCIHVCVCMYMHHRPACIHTYFFADVSIRSCVGSSHHKSLPKCHGNILAGHVLCKSELHAHLLTAQ